MGLLNCFCKRNTKVSNSDKNIKNIPTVVQFEPSTYSGSDVSIVSKKGSLSELNGKIDENLLNVSSTTDMLQEKTKRLSVEDPSNSFLKSHINSELLYAGTVGSTIASLSATKLIETMVDDNKVVDEDIFKNYDFPFMNLVFEGGGNKGMAYVGALQVLEDAGIAKNIKRVCGASVGAITASLVAVGYTSTDLKQFMETDLKKVLVDHRCGYCSLLPNLLSGFGWNPGNKLLKWFGEQLRESTGNPDITFREVLEKYGRELCLVVTNLSQMSTEYFHPKTTPNTPIRTAVRMSMALPGVYQSVRYKTGDDNDLYVDGGLLCNYPIHAFDGWWLSMESKDTFFKKLQPLDDYANLFSKKQRFGSWNDHTLGIMLYSHSETELMKTKLGQRLGNEPPPPPQSKLYRKRRKMRIRQAEATIEHQAVVKSVGRFMKELHRMHFDLDGVVSLTELSKVFHMSTDFTLEDKMLLFGTSDIKEAFRELDMDDDGEITFQELMAFVERKGVNIQTRFLGYTRKDINTLGEFIVTLQTALAINVKRNYVEDRDIERTIGIDTDYIEANDFTLENEDKDFLLESGARATRAFLRHYCRKNPEKHRRNSAMLSKDFFESPRTARRLKDLSNNNVMSRSSENIRMPSTNSLRLPNSLIDEKVAAQVQKRASLKNSSDGDIKSSCSSSGDVRRGSDVSNISLVAYPFNSMV